jgi:hypothetical protein
MTRIKTHLITVALTALPVTYLFIEAAPRRGF